MHHTAVTVEKPKRDATTRRLLTALFLSTATASGAIFTPVLAQDYSFSAITVEGNSTVDAPTIIGLAKSSVGPR